MITKEQLQLIIAVVACTIFGAHVKSRREIKPAPVRWAR